MSKPDPDTWIPIVTVVVLALAFTLVMNYLVHQI